MWKRKISGGHGDGYPVVLTADNTLMASYRLLFDGMLAASQTTSMPLLLMRMLLLPGNGSHSPAARIAPLGLRRIEAALISGGMSPQDVIVAEPDCLPAVIGAQTKIVGVSSGEPSGLGMNSSTITAITGGRIYPLVMYERLLSSIDRIIKRQAPNAKVVLGGPGAWQNISLSTSNKTSFVDHIITGYAEGNVARLFSEISNGNGTAVMEGVAPSVDNIPPIRGPTVMGAVEISRGCGLGCDFCTIRNSPMQHLPQETIVADVCTNLKADIRDIALLSEDFFRYGAVGVSPRPDVLISLLQRLRSLPQLRLIQIDHANIMSVAEFDDVELKTVFNLITGNNGNRYPWLNLGVESAVGRLLIANGARAKMGGVTADKWGDFCARQIRRLCDVGFFPMISLMICMPGETAGDVRATLEWVRQLHDLRIAIFPVIYAPIDGTPPPSGGDLTTLHWKLIRACYNFNFKYIPGMYWDNQAGAGVPWARRVLMQLLGRGQALQWSMLLRSHEARSIE